MSARTDIPVVFAYINYHLWLGEAFESIRENDPTMTHRKMSMLCGYKSSGAISLIASGERRMTQESARRVAKGVKLNAAERDHLLLMVAFEGAEDHEERQKLLSKMSLNPIFAAHWSEAIRAYEFYSKWYFPLVRELVGIGLVEPRLMAQQVFAKFSPRQAQRAMEVLEKLDLVVDQPQGYEVGSSIQVPHEVHTELFRHHQKDMARLAVDAIDWDPVPQRYMRATTYATSRNQAARVKAALAEAQRRIDEILAEEGPREVVYQLNTQWFPLTQTEVKKTGRRAPDADDDASPSMPIASV